MNSSDNALLALHLANGEFTVTQFKTSTAMGHYIPAIGILCSGYNWKKEYQLTFEEAIECRVLENQEGEASARVAILREVTSKVNEILKVKFKQDWEVDCQSPKNLSAIKALIRHDFKVWEVEVANDDSSRFCPVLHVNFCEDKEIKGGSHKSFTWNNVRDILLGPQPEEPLSPGKSPRILKHIPIESLSSPRSSRGSSPRSRVSSSASRDQGSPRQSSPRVLSPLEREILGDLDSYILGIINKALSEIWEHKKIAQQNATEEKIQKQKAFSYYHAQKVNDNPSLKEEESDLK